MSLYHAFKGRIGLITITLLALALVVGCGSASPADTGTAQDAAPEQPAAQMEMPEGAGVQDTAPTPVP